MIADGYLVGDGSWELRIYVTNLKTEKTLRVKGDLHIGGVMLNLVEDLGVSVDWSDHALWWPAKNEWLSRTRSTLDQCGVQADALLHFTPMHKTLHLQMPDLRYIDVKVDFSIKLFGAVVKMSKELGIRHPEEMSFCRPLVPDHLKRNFRFIGCSPRQRPKDSTGTLTITPNNTNDSLGTPGDNNTLNNSFNVSGYTGSPSVNYSLNGSPFSSFSLDGSMTSSNDAPLAHSPRSPSQEARRDILRPKTLIEKARINACWLDSSLSLMEQDVREFDCLLLRFKFSTFYDLNPKLDAVRINQIYEQSKWSLLSEEIDCTEEEMMLFSALQLQVVMQTGVPQPDSGIGDNEDDIDAALNDLQNTLEGTHINGGTPGQDITSVPQLDAYLRFMKPRKFTLRSFKRYYFTFRDTQLALYKSREEVPGVEPFLVIPLRGCEVTPDVHLGQNKYGIRLEVPSHTGMDEYWIRCDSEEQYAKWMAACRLAAKGKTMADSSYEQEVRSILEFLSLQHPAPTPALAPSQVDIVLQDYVAPRFIKKSKSSKLIHRILEGHANVNHLSLVEAKLNYIKAWQALPEYGVSLFVVKFQGSKKEELLGVAFNRLMRMELSTGDHIKTWRFNTMKSWHINWEVKQLTVQFEEENGCVNLAVLSADCKTVHEFIGGYIFLSMRSKDQNQALNEELFHKLTGGWV